MIQINDTLTTSIQNWLTIRQMKGIQGIQIEGEEVPTEFYFVN